MFSFTQLLAFSAVAALSFVSPVSAHCSVASPAPRGGASQANNTPYDGRGGPFAWPCQGKPAGPISTTVTAGSSVRVEMVRRVAVHRGGICQWAVSYDNGANFVNIQIDRDCPGLNKYVNGVEQNEQDGTNGWDVRLPSDLPASDRAILAWTWVPTVSGPPEFYMNCIDVKINSGNTGSFTGKKLAVVNVQGQGPLIQNDLARLRQMIDSAPSITVSGNGSSSGGGSAPPPPVGGGNGGGNGGCPESGMCRSKWGFCGFGAAYCNSAIAEIDDSSDEFVSDSTDSSSIPVEATQIREWTPEHTDSHLKIKRQGLAAELQAIEEMSREVLEEFNQVASELNHRSEYDSRISREMEAEPQQQEEEHRKPKKHAKKNHHRRHQY